jgi:hypothetical protein
MANKKTKNNEGTIIKFDDNDLINVMNYTTGECIWINPMTKQEWSWLEFGSVLQISFSEITVIKGHRPQFFTKPYLVILDDDVVKFFNWTDFYKLIIKPENINDFYNLSSEELVKFLHNTTPDVRKVIVNLTKKNIKNNTFNDMFKTKLIQETINEINKKDNEDYFNINLFDVFDEEFEL